MKLWVWLLSGLLFTTANQVPFAAPTSVTHVMQNDFTALCMVDSVLVAAGNNSICTAVFDAPSKQFLPASLSDYAGPAKQIRKLGELVVIQSNSGFLTVLSALALPQIVVVDFVAPPTPYLDFTLLNGQLFLACGFEGIRQYQLAGNGSATLVDSSLIPVHAVALTCSASRLYVADDYTGIVVYEPSLSNLGAPTMVVPIAGPTISLAVRSDTIFAGSGIAGISLFRDGGNSVVPIAVLPGHAPAGRIVLADTLVLSISPGGNRGDLLSLAGHVNPIAIESTNMFLGGDTFVSGGDIYFVAPTTDGDLSRYDLGRFESGGSQPQRANWCGGIISGVGVDGDNVVVTRSAEPTISFSVTGQQTQAGNLIFSGLGGMTQVAVAEGRYFFYSHDDQVVYVASDSHGQIQLDTVVTLYDSTFESIRVTGPVHDSSRLLSILAANSIELYRVATDWSVNGFARLYLPEKPIDFASVDTLLAVGCSSNVYLYSISDDLFLTYRSTIGLSPALGQLVRLLSDPSQSTTLSLVTEVGVTKYDLSVPSSPLRVGSIELESSIFDAVQSGDYVYLATADNGLLRVHSPEGVDPVVVDSARLVGDKLAVAGTTVSIASDHGLWIVDWSVGSDVDEREYAGLPSGFQLEQNYPNPFNPATRISYELSKPGHVELTVFNLLGQPVQTLVESAQSAGAYTAVFDATEMASGVYFYRLTTPSGSQSRKMVLVK